MTNTLPPRPVQRALRVLEVRHLAGPSHYLIVVERGDFPEAAPGQFAMLRAWDRDPLLPRAFSVRRVTGDTVEFLGKVIGRGTQRLGALVAGDRLVVHGPLGRPFQPPGDPAQVEILVAGGVGLAPLLFYAEEQAARGRASSLHLIYGGRRGGDLVLTGEIARTGATLTLTTEDGSRPRDFPVVHGRVTDVLPSHLAAGNVRVLTCGPTPMMRAVAEMAAAAGRQCLVSLEGEMACGVGVCLGCPVATVSGKSARKYEYCCVDGPVFDAARVVIQ